MTILLIIFVALAIASVPPTRFVAYSKADLDDAPSYVTILLYSFSFILWADVLFPVWAAVVWAISHPRRPSAT